MTPRTPKPRGIIFEPWQVRAAIESRLEQVRIPFKSQPSEGWHPERMTEIHKMVDGDFPLRKGSPIAIGWGAVNSFGDEGYVCPFRVGDVFYVKERWGISGAGHGGSLSDYRFHVDITYESDKDEAQWEVSKEVWRDFNSRFTLECDKSDTTIFRSAGTMPSWAARLWFTVTAVRAERVREISEADAIACGVLSEPSEYQERQFTAGKFIGWPKAVDAYEAWYLNRHRPDSFDNDWCFPLTIKPIAPGEAEKGR